ncbi:MAG TPA: hypothetical protein VJ945_08370, partial [Flavobacteriaceae bacterium]|nr:hypothetical protein [Flavobacteriaceae bacterium]
DTGAVIATFLNKKRSYSNDRSQIKISGYLQRSVASTIVKHGLTHRGLFLKKTFILAAGLTHFQNLRFISILKKNDGLTIRLASIT